MALWQEARETFVQSLRKAGEDDLKVRQFLADKTTPEDTKKFCSTLQTDAGQKYGDKKINDKVVLSAKWIDRIMGNIDRFIAVGNYAMKGAPETVGLAWFAVKTVLGAVQNNYKLYEFLQSSVSDITEMMVLIGNLDKLYDQRQKANWSSTEIVESLFSHIRNAYAAILDYAYSVKYHLKTSKLGRAAHVVKDLLGSSQEEFVAKMATIKDYKVKIMEAADGNFQQKMLQGVDSIQGSITGVNAEVQGFRQELAERMSMLTELVQEQNKADKHQPTHYELAKKDFERYKKGLNPMKNSTALLERYCDKQQAYPDTCKWVFDTTAYASWHDSETSSLLWLDGGSGSGKSVVLATIMSRLRDEKEKDSPVFLEYICCDADVDGTSKTTALRVQNTILHDLYDLAGHDQNETLTLQKCNDVFRDPKQKKKSKNLSKPKEDENSYDFTEAMTNLSLVLEKEIWIIIDACDSLPSGEQKELIESLDELLQSKKASAHIAIASKPEDAIYASLLAMEGTAFQLSIDDNNTDDIKLVLQQELQAIPGLTASERSEATETVLANTRSRFKYLQEIAIPHLKQPFPRPLSTHLEYLPDSFSDSYTHALNALAPNQAALLKTTLLWCMIGIQWPTIAEVMDIYMGLYATDDIADDGSLVEDSAVVPDSEQSDLRVRQLREAVGSFIEVQGSSADRWVWPRDWFSVEKWCVDDTEPKTLQRRATFAPDQLCARCSQERDRQTTFKITPKEGHLQIALTCLRHMNNNRFQRRFLLFEESVITDAEPQVEDSEAGDGAATAEAQDANDSETIPKQGPETSAEDGNSVTEEPASGEALATADTENSGDDAVSEDASLDSEDRGDPTWGDTESSSEYIRYEVNYWIEHAELAERHWRNDDKAENEDWKTFQEELYKLMVQNTVAFHAWQKKCFDYGPDYLLPIEFAARYGLLELVERLVKEGADIRALSPQGMTPLHRAVLGGKDNLPTVHYLLANGADPNVKSGPRFDFITPLQRALGWDAGSEVIGELLKHGADCRLANESGSTPLHFFAYNGTDSDTLHLLLDNPHDPSNVADINALDVEHETPLHKLMSRSNIPIPLLQAFVKRGADVDAEDKHSERPLYEASCFGELKALREIIDKVTDVNDPTDTGRTALHVAAWHGHQETVELLVEHEADVNSVDLHDRTPLFFACLGSSGSGSQSEDVAMFLLNKLIEKAYPIEQINKATKTGRTPLREAAAHGFTEVVTKLLSMITNLSMIDQQDSIKGRNALMCATLHGEADIVKIILQKGGHTSLKSGAKNDGPTAMELCHERWAANVEEERFESTMAHLIEHDPEAAAENRDIMATAVATGNMSVLQKLHDARVDFNKPDQYGWTPLLLAKQCQQAEVAAFLEKRMANNDPKPTAWNLTEKFKSLAIVSGDTLTVEWPGDERCALIAERPIPADREKFYFEVTLSQPTAFEKALAHPILAIGVCNSAFSHHLVFPGWPSEQAPSAHSWAYHGDDGHFLNYTSYEAQGSADMFGPGDTVGCIVDYEAATVSYTLNGRKHKKFRYEDVRERLFPVLGFHDRVRVETNFGQKPFLWDPLKDDVEAETGSGETVDANSVPNGESLAGEEVQNTEQTAREEKIEAKVGTTVVITAVSAEVGA